MCVCVQGQLSYRLCSVLIRERTHWLPNLVTVCTSVHMYTCVGLCNKQWCVASPTGTLGGVIGTYRSPSMYVCSWCCYDQAPPCCQTALLCKLLCRSMWVTIAFTHQCRHWKLLTRTVHSAYVDVGETQGTSMTCCCFCGVFQSVTSGSMCMTCRSTARKCVFSFYIQNWCVFPLRLLQKWNCTTLCNTYVCINSTYVHMYCIYSTVQYYLVQYSTVL